MQRRATSVFTATEIRWRRRYAPPLIATEIILIVWDSVEAQLAHFGLENSAIVVSSRTAVAVNYLALLPPIIFVGMVTLTIFGMRDSRAVGTGATEYTRVFYSSHGLQLIHVETPRYEGLKRFSKRAFDLATSTLLIILLSPLLVVIAMVIRLGAPGSVLFTQSRVGLRGGHFKMLKFRSMVVDAEERLAELQEKARREDNTVLFKMKDDPRVTPIGRVLRSFSLDELPQLFNVFAGSMSLVGPRPPLEGEVVAYEPHVHRRFQVKPGITGLWQVSGRANLSWEDSVRLDLYYVENWSLGGDLVILLRTVPAVLARDGAC